MKRIILFLIGGACGAFALIALARLRQFVLEPDYIARCDGGTKG